MAEDQRPKFEWKRPSDGKVFQWRPLTVGKRMSVEHDYQGDQSYQRQYALAALRLLSDNGHSSYSMEEFRLWEEDDFLDFQRHFMDTETARLIQKKSTRDEAINAMEAALYEYTKAATHLMDLGRNVIAIARSVGPLEAAG